MANDPSLTFQHSIEWRTWLEANHASRKEAWLVILKKHAPGPGVTYEQAVEEALCFGWIDGVMRPVDAETYRLRFSPRRANSLWSISNQQRVARLLAEGRMTEAGLLKVREAQENGEWDSARLREDFTHIPDDLQAALQENALAQANFDSLPPSQKKQFLFWIMSAKTAQTRQRRIEKTVTLAAAHQRLGQA